MHLCLMRIIAGLWRGRALLAPSGETTRPTADRVRQALFDMLLHAPWGGRNLIEGARVLDVFAGTGALGLEALSRGAAKACFIERDRAALAALRALEQVRTCVCYARTNVKIAASYAGVSDFKDGPTHHAITDIAIMRSLPEMTVIVPADGSEAAAFVPLIAEFDGPVYFRLNRAAALQVSQPGEKLTIGKGIVRRQGTDVTIIACGSMAGRSMQAANSLASQGIQARVIEIHTVKPIDRDLLLQAAADTGAIVTAEEHTVIGGLGSAVAEVLAAGRPVPLAKIGRAHV